MRTLALIAALLLLALQAPAELLQERADQVPAQDQPVAEHQGQPGTEVQDQPGAEVQDQPGAEGQDMAITFAGDKAHLAQNASGEKTNNVFWGSGWGREALPRGLLQRTEVPTGAAYRWEQTIDDDSGLAESLRKITTCYCRRGLCHLFERRSGTCLLNGYQYRFCCR
ncbi:defensin-5 [Rousettus aegyptiacus]|uniref:defensin-5 n=1 Tax=Rousettus aegyptiacus TaxID=9407 RepID=UPI00168CF765|nr:defensin-5 [Rousettus aegyptiacus]